MLNTLNPSSFPSPLSPPNPVENDSAGESDLSLVHRIQLHDPDALSTLYDRYSTPVYSVALFVTGDSRLAEEATQDAFMKLWTRAEQYHDRQDRFRSWLLVITRHCAVDILRREFRRSRSHASLDEDTFTYLSDVQVEADFRWCETQSILNDLPPAQAQVIVLSFYRGLSLKAIADHLHVPLPTIKTRAKLGLRKLRNMVIPPGNPASLKSHSP